MAQTSFRSTLRDFAVKHLHPLYFAYSEWVRSRLPADDGMVVPGPGFQIEIFPPRESVIGRSLYRTGIWEPEMTAFVQKTFQPGWRVIDIGAHIGYYTLLFAKQVGAEGAVLAFEPMPRERAILQRNIERNQLNTVRVYDYALSDHTGTAVMKPDCRGQMQSDTQGAQEDTVEMIPLDNLWESIGWDRLDVVKIDVEGAEAGVLKGMTGVLKKYQPFLLMEVHPPQLRDFGSSAGEVIDWLASEFGYSFTPVDADHLDFTEKNITVWGIPPGK